MLKPNDHGINKFSDAELDRIRRETFVKQIELHRELPSTNDLALELAADQGNRFPLLVLAEVQTAGRGRGENRWWSASGALTFSVILETEVERLPQRRWPRASLAAGLAVCETIEDLIDEQDVRLKWPNDVYLNGRKLSGVLVEVPRIRQGMLVIGIGVNVNNVLHHGPPELTKKAISLREITGQCIPLADVLVRVVDRLSQRLRLLDSRDDQLCQSWKQRCLLTDRFVRVDLGTRKLEGTCQGIDAEGALILETADGAQRCFAGVVTQID